MKSQFITKPICFSGIQIFFFLLMNLSSNFVAASGARKTFQLSAIFNFSYVEKENSQVQESFIEEYSEVITTIPLKTTRFLQDVQIVFYKGGKLKPKNLIEEANGKSPDLNHRFRGDYVYLVGSWREETTLNSSSLGVSFLNVTIQRKWNRNLEDMAHGCPGDYRYLQMEKSNDTSKRITKIALYRTVYEDINPGNETDPWQFWTKNINEGRGKDFLYLCWNTTDTTTNLDNK